MRTLHVKTDRRTQLVDVTRDVQKAVQDTGVLSGICCLYVPHTTAGILINEHVDPDVAADIEAALDRMVPRNAPYSHSEGNSDSHIKSALAGSGQIVPIEGGKLSLGRWQGIFFCEFDGPRDRSLNVKILPDAGR